MYVHVCMGVHAMIICSSHRATGGLCSFILLCGFQVSAQVKHLYLLNHFTVLKIKF